MTTAISREAIPPRPSGHDNENPPHALAHPNENDHRPHARSLLSTIGLFLKFPAFRLKHFAPPECLYLPPLLYLPRIYAARAIEGARAERFIDSLPEEWRASSGLSTVLLTTAFSSFQVQGVLDDLFDSALVMLCLITAFISLLHGITLTIAFETIKRLCNATVSAEETSTSVRLKPWIIVAMPAVWFAWSSLFFLLAILNFGWRLGSTIPTSPIPPDSLTAIGTRVLETMVLVLGLLCYTKVVLELRRGEDWGIDGTLLAERSADESPSPC